MAAICSVGLLAPVAVLMAADAAAEKAVLQAEADRMKALVDGNGAALEKLLGDDLTYVHSAGGPPEGKKELVEEIGSGKRDYAGFSGEEQTARVYGTTAIVNGIAVVTNMAIGKAQPPFKIRYIAVHVNRNGQWQLVAFQATRPPDPK